MENQYLADDCKTYVESGRRELRVEVSRLCARPPLFARQKVGQWPCLASLPRELRVEVSRLCARPPRFAR